MEENKKKMNKNLIIKLVCAGVVLVALIVLVVTIFNNSITASEYNKIELGMSYEEVVEIVGCEGECLSDIGGGNFDCTWKGVTYLLNGANANIMFIDGKVYSMAQIGLIF